MSSSSDDDGNVASSSAARGAASASSSSKRRSKSKQKQLKQIRRLEPTLSAEDGSLLSYPLSTVLNAATDALYQDLHDMTYGELTLASVPPPSAAAAADDETGGGGAEGGGDNEPPASGAYNAAAAAAAATAETSTKKERMANLSYAQRRHELSVRLAKHSRSATHAAALISSYVPPPHHHHRHGHGQHRIRLHAHKDGTAQHGGDEKEGENGDDNDNDAAVGRIGPTVQASSEALRLVRTAWTNADEAQDALYFHHAELWKARRHCHDVLGAMGLVASGFRSQSTIANDDNESGMGASGDNVGETTSSAASASSAAAAAAADGKTVDREGYDRGTATWIDFPTDVALLVDRYDASNEKSWSKVETARRLRSNVRRKLTLGEAGCYRSLSSLSTTPLQGNDERISAMNKLPWKITLERGGGAVRLTHGTPRSRTSAEELHAAAAAAATNNGGTSSGGKLVYPIEARLTVLTEDDDAPWTLLSVQVRVHPKTGESNHQLESNQRQMFDLHRMCARAMAVEEAVCRKANQSNDEGEEGRQRRASQTQSEKEEDGEKRDGDVKKEEKGQDGDVQMADVTNGNVAESDSRKRRRPPLVVPRPLDRLFEVAHSFAVSLQLEILSSQAEALRRGAWGGAGGEMGGSGGMTTTGIAVSPVHFFEPKEEEDEGSEGQGGLEPPCLAVMAIHFWSVDDRHGAPRMGDLSLEASASTNTSPMTATAAVPSAAGDGSSTGAGSKQWETSSVTSSTKRFAGAGASRGHLPTDDKRGSGRLTLCVRAVPRVGIAVSLSGGDGVTSALARTDGDSANDDDGIASRSGSDERRHLRRNVDKLLSSIQDPFRLSASDALLAATVLCAERRCRAVVDSLERARRIASEGGATTATTSAILPPWIHLGVECGSISIAAELDYHGEGDDDNEGDIAVGGGKRRVPVVLFRLACDSRSGRFVAVFPRPASLLRKLACNDPSGSDVQALRAASIMGAGSTARRRADAAARDLTGRVVRDAFDGLSRSMDVLGRRAGVGGGWDDRDRLSASLRERAVELACSDARTSLATCAAISAVYGVAALALGVAGGVDANADMAGGHIDDDSLGGLLRIPPVGIAMSQNFIERTVTKSDNETKRISLLEREVFAMSAVVNDKSLTIHCFDVATVIDSATSVPKRLSSSRVLLKPADDLRADIDDDKGRVAKRPRLDDGMPSTKTLEIRRKNCQFLDEVKHLAVRLNKTLF